MNKTRTPAKRIDKPRLTKADHREFAETIYDEGWLEAFDTDISDIPKELREAKQKIDAVCAEVQPLIDKFLAKHPWSEIEERRRKQWSWLS